eukprot:709907-Prorocentrum_minimum.AAC.1
MADYKGGWPVSRISPDAGSYSAPPRDPLSLDPSLTPSPTTSFGIPGEAQERDGERGDVYRDVYAPLDGGRQHP